MQLDDAVRLIAEKVADLPRKAAQRNLIAVAGPPASGKSTLAEVLADRLPDAQLVPMDGFHLDNAVLDQRGLRHRKGAPETFDLGGLRHMLTRLQTEPEVAYPKFDRALDRSIAGAGVVDETSQTIVIEGNYLLLDAPGWRDLTRFWDFSAYLSVPDAVLHERLMERWRTHGFSDTEAARKTHDNDLPNAHRIRDNLLPADLIVEEKG